MKVENTSFFIGNGSSGVQTGSALGNDRQRSSGISLDGSALNDPVAAKREEARRKAMKVIGDAFAGDRKIDDDLKARSEHIRQLKDVQNKADNTVKEIESDRAKLRDTYGVDAQSSEEEELKLLEKEFRSHLKGSGVHLTMDEKREVEKIKERGLSEYQTQSMEMLDSERSYIDESYEAGLGIEEENLTISAIKRELPKNTAMLKAQEKAGSIEDAASKEIMGMLIDDAKEHIDEEAKEQEEKAKEKKEKEEELEEKIDAARQKRREQEELTEDIVESAQELTAAVGSVGDAQKDIRDMMNKLALIEEDMKGAAVDEKS